ncbi:MAG: Uma2 family endonuclease [Isosphaeraceae bacterium]|nr:Uma2 family endonuclease [Isosphaeraceae bacterium]
MATVTPPDTVADEPLYEVVDGEVVEKPAMGAYSTWLASIFHDALSPWVRERQLGRVVTEMLFRINRAKDLQRRPDVAFVSFERWPQHQPIPDEPAWDVVPDLAIEVVSRSNSAAEVQVKIRDYFKAGVRQVWVVYPTTREVYAFDSPTSVRILERANVLDGTPLLAGFLFPLASLFEDETG